MVIRAGWRTKEMRFEDCREFLSMTYKTWRAIQFTHRLLGVANYIAFIIHKRRLKIWVQLWDILIP